MSRPFCSLPFLVRRRVTASELSFFLRFYPSLVLLCLLGLSVPALLASTGETQELCSHPDAHQETLDRWTNEVTRHHDQQSHHFANGAIVEAILGALRDGGVSAEDISRGNRLMSTYLDLSVQRNRKAAHRAPFHLATADVALESVKLLPNFAEDGPFLVSLLLDSAA